MDTTSVRLAVIAELTKASKQPQYAGRTLIETLDRLTTAALRGCPDDLPDEVISIGQVILQYFDDQVPAIADEVKRARVLKKLPPLQRRALRLHVDEGLTYIEVATQLGISKEHALSLLTMAYSMAAETVSKKNDKQALLDRLQELAIPLLGEGAAVERTVVDIASMRCVRETGED